MNDSDTSFLHALREAGLADVRLTGIFPEGSEYDGAKFSVRPTPSTLGKRFDLVLSDSLGAPFETLPDLTQIQVIDRLARLM